MLLSCNLYIAQCHVAGIRNNKRSRDAVAGIHFIVAVVIHVGAVFASVSVAIFGNVCESSSVPVTSPPFVSLPVADAVFVKVRIDIILRQDIARHGCGCSRRQGGNRRRIIEYHTRVVIYNVILLSVTLPVFVTTNAAYAVAGIHFIVAVVIHI